MDPATFKLILDCGHFGLLAFLLVKGLPWLFSRIDLMSSLQMKGFRDEMKSEREAHARERSEDRTAFTAAIDRNTKAVEANTQETKAATELIRRQTAKG